MSQRFIKPISVKDVLGVIGYNNPTPPAVAPLRLTNIGNDSAEIRLLQFQNTDSRYAVVEIRKTQGEWQTWGISGIDPNNYAIHKETVAPGEYIELRSDAVAWYYYPSRFGIFRINNSLFRLSGSIMSLVYGKNLTEENNKVIPSDVQVSRAFMGMFGFCNIESAPELPATDLYYQCYHQLFYDCGQLNYVSVAFKEWVNSPNPSDSATYQWMHGVSPTGVFRCPAELDTSIRDDSHIPAGWTIETY